MKHYYFQSRLLQRINILSILLSAVTLTVGCTSDLGDGLADPKATEIKQTVEKDDSILRFLTIEDLENITLSDIPGDYSGYELTELTYECTDTIELRALRFNVIATLQSTGRQKINVSFTADVGPDLVSVEYYPGGEIIPAHDNMMTAFYPKVERYRNYSDGSRIGPDEFYDYGHFLGIYIGTQDGFFMVHPSVINYDMDVIPTFIGNQINPESIYFENGIYYQKHKTIIEHNLNTTVIAENGSTYKGEDFFNIIPVDLNQIYGIPFIREETSQITNYYSTPHDDAEGWPVPGYRSSRTYDEYLDKDYWLNLCCNVPDVSPVPFPNDTESLKSGWYYGEFSDRFDCCGYLFSRYNIGRDKLLFGSCIDLYLSVVVYLQYLVIDNRIIHFNDLALKDYCGIRNMNPKQTITKTSDGYLVTTEQEVKLYGERLKNIYEIEMKGIQGPEDFIDNSSYYQMGCEDKEELDELSTRSADQLSEKKTLIPREDGKIMVINRQLPNTLNNYKTRSTLKRK